MKNAVYIWVGLVILIGLYVLYKYQQGQSAPTPPVRSPGRV